MGRHNKRLLAAWTTLFYIFQSAVSGANSCGALRSLENGQTFFRYRGLFVIFSCHHGYKIHGHKTNSCVNGRWSREPPICVGSGCPLPAPVSHGSFSVNSDSSWVQFSCEVGHKLIGPSSLYCKGDEWSSPQPVCEESDLMHSLAFRATAQKPLVNLTLQATVDLKTQTQNFHHITQTTTKNTTLHSELPNSRTDGARSKLQQQISTETSEENQNTQVKSTTQQTFSKDVLLPITSLKKYITTYATTTLQNDLTKQVQATTVPSLQMQSRTFISLPIRVTAQKPPVNWTFQAIEAVKTKFPSHHITQTPPKNTTLQFDISHTKFLTVTSEENQKRRVKSTTQQTFSKELLLPVTSMKKYMTTSELTKTISTSTGTLQNDPTELVQAATVLPSLQIQAITFNKLAVQNVAITTKTTKKPVLPSLSSAMSTLTKPYGITANFLSAYETTSSGLAVNPMENVKSSTITANIQTTEPPVLSQSTLSDQTTPQNVATSFKSGTKQNNLTTQTGFLSLQPDLLPTKSTLTKYFTSIVFTVTPENKIYSTIQTTKTEKSDITKSDSSCADPPVPANGAFYFRNTDPERPAEKGHFIQYVCSTGFKLAKGDAVRYCQDGAAWSGVTPVCEDVDECKEGLHRCPHRCINTPGSFLCSCPVGHQPSPDRTSCTDVDECAFPVAVTGCLFGCVNSPGSFHCLCPSGFTVQSPDSHCQDINECADNSGLGPCSERCHNSPGSFHCSCSSGFTLASDGHTCVSECPKGYKRQPHNPYNSTLPPIGQCIDINECEEQDDWCEWKCINLPGSYRCICPRGYTLTRDGRRCRDINECSENNGGCSHLCINRRGTFKCSCPPSHRLSTYSWSKCVPRISAI